MDEHRSTLFDDVAYWLTIASVYVLIGVLFFSSGKGRRASSSRASASGSCSPVSRSPSSPSPCLSFGQTSTGNNEGTASLFTYFGATAVVILLPPNRPRAWLSGGGPGSS